jgi:nucleotide-binding universal stress UspA family protein
METKRVQSVAEISPAPSKALFNKIMVAMDGSESSQRAAQVALELADKLKAELVILHGVTPPASYYRSSLASRSGIIPPSSSQHEIDAYYAYAKRAALEIVGETESKAKKQGIPVKIEIPEAVSSVVETIVNHAAKESIDLIVVGSRGLGGFKKMLIGSVSSGVISHAQCPVLVVR